MAGIQTYPTGTPAAGDKVPYVSDPAGTPALKLADAAGLGGALALTSDGHTTNTLIVTGTTETVVATVTMAADALLIMGISVSNSDPNIVKDLTVRIRRTNTSGAILWAASTGGGGDDVTGNQFRLSANVIDVAGTWVLTVQETAGSGTTVVWSARAVLAAIAV